MGPREAYRAARRRDHSSGHACSAYSDHGEYGPIGLGAFGDKITFLPVSCAFALPSGKGLNAMLLNIPAVMRELARSLRINRTCAPRRRVCQSQKYPLCFNGEIGIAKTGKPIEAGEFSLFPRERQPDTSASRS
jgi:hypothetical protein